jgi:molybdopterin synthase catalytic subunit
MLKRGGTLESALAELERDGMDFAIVEGFKQSSLPKIVLGGIRVSNIIRELNIADLDEALIDELTGLVLDLQEYEPESIWPG